MLIDQMRKGFDGFGASYLAPNCAIPFSHHTLPSEEELRQAVRSHCPRTPGVYGMVDCDGELIYVGKSKQLRSRLLSYFRGERDEHKGRRIIARTVTLLWEPAVHEFAALVRELELIQRWRPRFNVQGQPGRRRGQYVCIGRAPAPHVFLTREPTTSAAAYFGPVRGNRQAVEAVRKLNDHFGLRDCPSSRVMHFADQKELFSPEYEPACLRYEIGACLGACIGACTRQKYTARVRLAKAFLAGQDARLLEEIAAKMLEAAAARQFERAAGLRDVLQSLTWLNDALNRLRNASGQFYFVYPLETAGGVATWYFIHGGRVVGAVAEPTTIAEAKRVAELIEAAFAQPTFTLSRARFVDLDQILLTAAWFRKFPAELAKVLTAEQALARCHRPGQPR